MKRLPSLLLVAVVAMVSGCSLFNHTFQMTFPASGVAPITIDPLPIVLIDRTGMVTSMEPAPDTGVFLDAGVSAVAGDPAALVLTWLGGMCDEAVTITMAGVGSGIEIEVATRRSGGGCRLAAIGRHVLVHLAAPIDPKTVTVRGG